jgi:phosphate transport system permease protein
VSRAIGEAAPLLLVGAVTFATFDPSYFESGYTTLPTLVFNYSTRPQEELRTLAAAGAILILVFVLVMNSFAIWLRNRFEQRW